MNTRISVEKDHFIDLANEMIFTLVKKLSGPEEEEHEKGNGRDARAY